MEERIIEWTEYGQTEVHWLAMALTLAMSAALCTLPRSRAVWPIALVACFIPVAQRVVIASIDLSMLRILLLFGWARLASRGELRRLRLNPLDGWFCGWIAAGTLVHVARELTVSALVYRLGFAFDALGTYFLFRFLLRDGRDIQVAIRQMAWICMLLAVGMTVEWSTGNNVFSIFGGVPAETIIRDDRLRCQGAFSHPIMVGSFGAGMAPLFFGLALVSKRSRFLPGVAFAASTWIMLTSASSGPALAYIAGVFGWAFWSLRRYLRQFLWGMLLVLSVLHVIREKPVWHLIGRAGELIGAGTGYHRYRLIDGFVNHFREWWLLGTRSTAHWGWGMQDVTNQFVNEGVRGGFLTFVAFVGLVVVAFRCVGLARRRVRGRESYLAWGLGVALTVHCVSFISVAYFGQMQTFFYMLLAFIATLAYPRASREAEARRKTSGRGGADQARNDPSI